MDRSGFAVRCGHVREHICTDNNLCALLCRESNGEKRRTGRASAVWLSIG